jgi:hypothetical protein
LKGTLRKTEGTLKKIVGLIEKPGFTKAKKYRLQSNMYIKTTQRNLKMWPL